MGFWNLPCGTTRRKTLLAVVFLNIFVFVVHEYRFFYPSLRTGPSKVSSKITYQISNSSTVKPKLKFDALPFVYMGSGTLGQFNRKKQFVPKTTTTTYDLTTTTVEDKQNDSILTLVYEKKRPRPNMNMDYFLKTSGWLDRQMRTNYTVYPYNYILGQDNRCPDQGRNLTLLASVLTSVRNTAQRMAIRDTWGKELRNKGSKLVFFLGKVSNRAVQDVIDQESKDYRDMVQEDFVDSYYNLSTKTVSMLRWVNTRCSRVRYVFKTDDDIYVNVNALLDALDSYNDTTPSIHGMLAHRWRPIRDKRSKWFVPFRNYPWAHYPDFVAGPAYIISRSAIKPLYKTAFKMNPFFLEDVFLTGMVAVQAGVPRINQLGIRNSRDSFDPCRFNMTLTSHSHPSWDVRRRHTAVHSRMFYCRSGSKLKDNMRRYGSKGSSYRLAIGKH